MALMNMATVRRTRNVVDEQAGVGEIRVFPIMASTEEDSQRSGPTSPMKKRLPFTPASGKKPILTAEAKRQQVPVSTDPMWAKNPPTMTDAFHKLMQEIPSIGAETYHQLTPAEYTIWMTKANEGGLQEETQDWIAWVWSRGGQWLTSGGGRPLQRREQPEEGITTDGSEDGVGALIAGAGAGTQERQGEPEGTGSKTGAASEGG
eukprot:g3201.t1